MKLSALKEKQWFSTDGSPEQQLSSGKMKRSNRQLSKRETEVLHLVAKGMTANQVAEKLYVSLDTIETHKKNIVRKLNANNTVEAVVKAVRMRMI